MRKILPLFCFAVILMAVSLGADEPVRQPRFLPEVFLNGMPYRQIEVAMTDAELRKGLMDRTYLADDGGMLFFYGRPKFTAFWMKNTRIPLDVIFLNAEGVVLQINTMAVEPPRAENESEEDYEERLKTYLCSRPVTSALEIKAGRATELGLTPGTCIPELSLRALLQNITALPNSEGK